MKKRLRATMLALVALALLGGVLWNDKDIAKWRGSFSPVVTTGAVARDGTTAPADVARYVEAFCAADVAYLAAHTSPAVASAELIADYFASDPVVCRGARYLGSLADQGQDRFIVVLDFGERQDWLVITWEGGFLTGLKRG
jgi:hypothetical protein